MAKQPYFHVIVKPTCDCNINCAYCYDRHNRERLKGTLMSDEILTHLAKLTSEYADKINWLWHGGEPTTVPIEWYEKAQDVFVENYMTEFEQSMQSNGVNFVLNPNLLEQFEELGISVGLSFDVLTQSTRLGKLADDMMEDYIDLLKRNAKNDSTGALTVVTNKNIDKLIDMYEYMKVKLKDYHYTMTLLFVSQHQEKQKTLEISPESLKENLEKFYAHVFFDDSEYAISEHNMNEYIQIILHGTQKCTCHYTDCRKSRLGINPDGEVMYCDTKFEKYPLGNILDYNSIEEIFTSDNYVNLSMALQRRYDECSKCAYFQHCKGGCNHMHMDTDGNIDTSIERVCVQFKERINNVYRHLQSIDKDTVINQTIRQELVAKQGLLPKEAEEVLAKHGFNVSLHIDDLTDFPSNPKFQLYSIFVSDLDATEEFHDLFSEGRYNRFDSLVKQRMLEIKEMISWIKKQEE